MHRRGKDGLRAGVTAVGVAAGLMALASTVQTPDGFVRASLGGPLSPFGNTESASDVLNIGDGATDPAELAALLKGPVTSTPAGAPESPFRAAFEAGGIPNAVIPNVDPSPDPAVNLPATEQRPISGPTSGPIPAPPAAPKSVVDAEGRVDCTGSVSCETDPITKVTTVTYPDGVVAIVQKINDLTVVAYKTLTEHLPPSIQTLLPPVPSQAPPALAAQAAPALAPVPAPAPLPDTPPLLAPPTQAVTAEPPIEAGPPAPEAVDGLEGLEDPDQSTSRGPRVNVTRPPMDFSPDAGQGGSSRPGRPGTEFPVLDKVRDALGSVVDTVRDGVGKAIGSGASGKATTSPAPADQSGSDVDAGQP